MSDLRERKQIFSQILALKADCERLNRVQVNLKIKLNQLNERVDRLSEVQDQNIPPIDPRGEASDTFKIKLWNCLQEVSRTANEIHELSHKSNQRQ